MSRAPFLFLSALAFSIAAAAALSSSANFCGSIDFRAVDNQTLATQVLLNDVKTTGHQRTRRQCGLPGETLTMCSACSDEVTPAMRESYSEMVGTPSHMQWHAKWHQIRASADVINPEIFSKLSMKNYVPGITLTDFQKSLGVRGTKSGEDFFYMHRLMIKMVQFQLAMSGQPCVAGWSDLPASVTDARWPVPHTPATQNEDSETLSALRAKLGHFRLPNYLESVSLNQLGNAVEMTLHQRLHELYRSSKNCAPDAPGCDDLLPVETSPLNKHFWKLHGLLDDLVGRWLTVHHYKEISDKCDSRSGCYEWKTTWVGPYPKTQN